MINVIMRLFGFLFKIRKALIVFLILCSLKCWYLICAMQTCARTGKSYLLLPRLQVIQFTTEPYQMFVAKYRVYFDTSGDVAYTENFGIEPVKQFILFAFSANVPPITTDPSPSLPNVQDNTSIAAPGRSRNKKKISSDGYQPGYIRQIIWTVKPKNQLQQLS